jgi:hypothetical protein
LQIAAKINSNINTVAKLCSQVFLKLCMNMRSGSLVRAPAETSQVHSLSEGQMRVSPINVAESKKSRWVAGDNMQNYCLFSPLIDCYLYLLYYYRQGIHWPRLVSTLLSGRALNPQIKLLSTMLIPPCVKY